MKKVSGLLQDLPDSAVSSIITKAAQAGWSDTLHLAGGEPRFDIPDGVIDALGKYDSNLITKYSPFCGNDFLLDLIKSKLAQTNNITTEKNEIIVVPGGSFALIASIMSVVDPGDEVLVSDPCWEHYLHIIKLCNAVPVRFKMAFNNNRYEVDMDSIKAATTKKTKAILLNTPLNPCGAMLSVPEAGKLINFCEEKDIWTIVDEEYESFIYGDNKHLSLRSLNKNVIALYSFSKSFALTGIRLGYITAPKEIINLIRRYSLYSVMYPPSPSQCIAIEVLNGDYVGYLQKVKNLYENKMLRLYNAIKDIPGVSCWRPEGGVYLFPEISAIEGIDVASELIEKHHLLCVPGRVAGDSSKNKIRFFIGVEDHVLDEAAKRLKEFMLQHKK